LPGLGRAAHCAGKIEAGLLGFALMLLDIKLRHRHRPSVRGQAGFTLFELLVVLGILALLATFAAPQVLRYLGKARSETSKIQINAIASAVELYALDNGGYPPQQMGLGALMQPPPGAVRWAGPYLKKAEGLVDPWGRPYQYRNPGRNGSFEIFTLGRDNAPGGSGEDQDVTN
jgi:general secretion pathway protein G